MKRTIKRVFVLLLAFTLMMLTVTLSVGAEDVEATKEDTTFFGEIYATVSEHSAEIFSALSLLGSCVIAFTYRNGLLPSIRQGIGTIGNAVSEIRSDTRGTSETTADLREALDSKLTVISEAISEFSTRLDEVAESEEHLRALDAVIKEQVELLYDIFMSSSIPDYKKESVGRRVEKMRSELLSEAVKGNAGSLES